MTTSQPPTSAAAATRLRPLANSTRDSAADSPKPTSPGANAMKVSASWCTCCGCVTNSRAAGHAAPASSAAPSQETSIAARTAPAAVRSNSPPAAAESSGNTLVAMGTASTAYGTKNICQP